MIWQRKTIKPLEAIVRTGFLVSLTSYVVFWIVDVVQPGFVSRYFSVHIFLLASVVFGLLWASVLDEYVSRPILQVVVVTFCGLMLAVLTWNLAQNLGVYRVPLTLISLILPSILYSLIRS